MNKPGRARRKARSAIRRDKRTEPLKPHLIGAALACALLAPISHAQARTADPAYKFEAG